MMIEQYKQKRKSKGVKNKNHTILTQKSHM